MSILAFDTTAGFCSVAIFDEKRDLMASRMIEEPSRQAELLIPTIEEILLEAKLSYHDISTLASTVGPGSFTGVRIGLAAAHGLLLATQASFFGVSTFEAVAWNVAKSLQNDQQSQPLHIVLDARRQAVFLQSFDVETLEPFSTPKLCSYQEAFELLGNTPAIIAGSGASLIKNTPPSQFTFIEGSFMPSADSITELVATKLKKGKKGLPPSPLYIRKPDAKLPTKKP